ncbi:MAG: UvrD-helicase domain-containing protein [Clostridia bacterium]|nr:UvrD-helicase domain-containing protein [Clostridia bacterium]
MTKEELYGKELEVDAIENKEAEVALPDKELIQEPKRKEKNFTDDQKKAIEFIDKDMLVSASAGSGKTTVMVEKIIRYLETGGINEGDTQSNEEGKKGDITRVIVLTFTRASAADMKEKLTKELSDAIRKGVKEASHFRKQLDNLPFAYIGTIDSICGQIYKKYFEELGTTPKLDMLDAEESKLMMSKAIDTVLARKIEENDNDFQRLADLYSNAKSLSGLKETLEIILKSLSAQESPNVFIENAIAEANKPLLECKAVKDAVNRYKEKFTRLLSHYDALSAELGAISDFPAKRQQKAKDVLAGVISPISSIAHATDETIFDAVSGAKVSDFGLPKNLEPECVNFIQRLVFFVEKVIKEIEKAQKLFNKPLAESIKEDDEGRDLVANLLGIVKEIRAEYAELKREEGKTDFEDVERYALQILQNEAKRKEFSEGIDYIFLDEYQDTNGLQEAIFGKIARDNVFMVGDIKQAIYGFREADPQIFLRKYELYKASISGENVPLNKNFRSDQEILGFVDNVFGEIMTPEFGGIDYKNGHAFGDAGLKPNKNGPDPKVEVAVYPEKRASYDALTEVYSVKNGAKATVKAKDKDLYIANKILEIVGKDYVTVENKKTGEDETRPIRYGDICVLYRSTTNTPSLLKIFDEYKIPYLAEGIEGKSARTDIDNVNSFLRIVDNFRQDHYLTGAMLSQIGGFDERELAEIRSANYDNLEFFHEAVLAYEGKLKIKIDDFLNRVDRYRKLSALVDVPTLIEQIMTESGYLSSLLAQGRHSRIEAYNCYVHLLRAKKFAKDLPAYVDFLDSGIEIDMPVLSHGDNAVKIMTMHKSKGLEFPIVFIARAEANSNTKWKNQSLVLDSDYGIGTKFFEEQGGTATKTTRRMAIETAIEKKQSDEALRLMYVAFTRAKYRLYVVGSPQNLNETGVPNLYVEPEDKTSFLGWVVAAAERNSAITLTKSPALDALDKEDDNDGLKSYEDGEPIFFDTYSCLESTTRSNKYTVTELNKESIRDAESIMARGEELFSDEPIKFNKKSSSETQSIEKGIAYHKVMEEIDFNLSSQEEIRNFIGELEKAETIPEGFVEANVIEKVFNTVIKGRSFRDRARAGKCLREQEFLYYAPIKTLAPVAEIFRDSALEDKTLVQGVMDLVIEGDENMLVDYKVSESHTDALIRRYKAQMEIYALAYEEITGRKLAHKVIVVLNRGEVIEF